MSKWLRYGLALGLLVSALPAVAAPGWRTYANPDTGLRVDLPAAIFERDAGPSSDGQGRKLVTADGRANITVQTMPNARGDTPAAYLAGMQPPAGIIYRRVTPRFFVVSSVRNDMIWYNRCNFSGRAAHCVLINYPVREKAQWDGIVTRISRTLSL